MISNGWRVHSEKRVRIYQVELYLKQKRLSFLFTIAMFVWESGFQSPPSFLYHCSQS
ncbi:hypothetical protein HB852_11870 [Listeria grandensis]|uniref:hypothetical protein n=1 Tax=Listeria grandensis TaxID=1494963 RepID=UPI00162A3C8E|nr:hypothetical protein [Listeria grandensis]MBC1475310.1 hypothetical protein [Listeria grandensis]